MAHNRRLRGGVPRKVAGRRSLATLKHRLTPLREAFGLDRAVDVSGESVEQYKRARLGQRTRRYGRAVSVATLNRELAALKTAFRLAVEHERLTWAPAIKLLPECNVRQGFVEPDTFEEIARRLPSPVDDAARFAYSSAWRKSEVLGLRWDEVDLEHHRVRLRPERSKNGEARVLPLTGELLELMRISGHKTISTFLRYRITSEEEIERALAATQRANQAVGGIVHRAQSEPTR